MLRRTGTAIVAVLAALSVGLASLGAGGCGGTTAEQSTAPASSGTPAAGSSQPQPAVSGVPYYFFAVHNEPQNRPNGRADIEKAYPVLEDMVARADRYNMKLTLMFSAQWADYIAESPERLAEVRSWKAAGHEISAHHHGVWHGSWDGYSSYSEAEADAIRIQQGHNPPEEYHGTLDDYMAHLYQLDPGVKSGCLNEEPDKQEMPDQILYGTGSGLANHGEPGVRELDPTPTKAINDFITVGNVNGIQRKWLAHYQIYHDLASSQQVFDQMDSGAFGGVVHSVQSQAEALYSLMEHIHQQDPQGLNSRTMTGIIEGGLLPEKTVSDEVINEMDTSPKGPRRGPRGPRQVTGMSPAPATKTR